ncbi:tetratricopeptide repeat-containing sensor histidine kinase [Mucilaginibacter phyllosphaerae]
MGKSKKIALIFVLELLVWQTFTSRVRAMSLSNIAIQQRYSDTIHIKSLLRLGQQYIERPGSQKRDLDSSLVFIKQAMQQAIALHSDKWRLEVLKWMGDSYLEGNNWEAGKTCFMEVVNYYRSRKDHVNEQATWDRFTRCIPIDKPRFQAELIKLCQQDTNKVRLMLRLGQSYIERPGSDPKDLDSGAYFIRQAKTLSSALHADYWRMEALKWLGDFYLEGGNWQQGRSSFMEVVNYYEKKQDRPNVLRTLIRFSQCLPYRPETGTIKEEIYKNLIQNYKAVGDRNNAMDMLKELAYIHLTAGRLSLAENEMSEVLSVYKAIKYPKIYEIYNLISMLHRQKGNIDKELYYDLEALKNAEASGDTLNAVQFYFNLGQFYKDQQMNRQSLYYFRRTLNCMRTLKNFDQYDMLTAHCAVILIHMDQPKQALSFITRSFSLSPPDGAFKRYAQSTAFGLCFDKLKQYKKAEAEYLEMLKQVTELYEHGKVTPEDYFLKYKIVLSFYVNSGQYSKAPPYLKKVLAAPPGVLNPSVLPQVHLMEYKVDSAAGRIAAALKHYILYKALEDSLFTKDRVKEIQDINIKYQTAQKQKDLELLQATDKLNQQALSEAIRSRKFYVSGLIMSLMIIGFVYNRYLIKQKNNQKLKIKQTEILTKNIALERLLKDNEWLLKEIHHRVKNNLQIVMSLLNSQSTYLHDEEALNANIDSQTRIQAMSLIHQKLYRDNNMTSIYMPDYINELVDYLKETYKTKHHVIFDKQVVAVHLDVQQAIPIGLILNEAITNSIKYAFKDHSDAIISVGLNVAGENEIILIVSDNGIGLPAGFDALNSHSFGMTMMKGLTEDLEGLFELSSLGGTKIKITFTLKDNHPYRAV